MVSLLKFNFRYFAWAIFLFVVEILIALFVHDGFIRPYVGDFLVVILIYCFLKSFLNLPVLAVALSVLLFSFIVEILQYFHLVEKLHLQHSRLARIIIGVSFEWIDLVAYTGGILAVIVMEKIFTNNKIN